MSWAQGMGDELRSDNRQGGIDVQKAANFQKDVLDKMGVDQRLGAKVPTDAVFQEADGRTVKFGELLGKRPMIIMPMFFSCQGVCGVETDSLLKSVIGMEDLNVGKDFDVILLSINPKENPSVTGSRWETVNKLYKRPGSSQGWHFLTGDITNIRKMTDALGFKWVYDAKEDRFNHPAGLMVLAADGTITSYVINKEFAPPFLRTLVNEAKTGEVSKKSEPILFGCIMIDRATGARSLMIENVIRLSAAVFAVFVGLWIAGMVLSERRKKQKMITGGVA